MAIIPAHFRLIFKSIAGFAWNLFTCQLAAQERQNDCSKAAEKVKIVEKDEPIKDMKVIYKKRQPLKNRENSIEHLAETVRELDGLKRYHRQTQTKQEDLEEPKKSGPLSQLVQFLVLFLFGTAQ